MAVIITGWAETDSLSDRQPSSPGTFESGTLLGRFFVCFLIIFCCCSRTVVSTFPRHSPLPHPPPPPTLNPIPLWLCPWVLYTFSLVTLPLFSPVVLLPPPLWPLSVCFLFQCPWFYFARLSVLLIRFHL